MLSRESARESRESIHPETYIGMVVLTIPSLDRSLPFYTQVVGLHLLSRQNDSAHLGAPDGREIVRLVESREATPPPGRATGLYHLAIRVPTRIDLARTIRRLVAARWPIQGFADHWVSEAVYLADPDGNGIEIYSDRPRSEWPYQDENLQMATEPLDVDGLLAGLKGQPEPENAGFPAGTDLGHIHLQVSDIAEAERFYVTVLGFDLVTRYGSSAGFVSAGGYHHHIGFNTWGSTGAQPPPAGAVGLRYFTICFPNSDALEFSLARLRAADIPVLEVEEGSQAGFQVVDPAGIKMLLLVVQNFS